MASWSVRARPARGALGEPIIDRDADLLASFLEDAAHFPGGRAAGLVVATSEADVASTLRMSVAVLPIGAQSSLTGGATPRGEVLLGTHRLKRIIDSGRDWIRVEPGLTVAELDDALAALGKYYPPAPTFDGAFVGGTVATNAAGAATFKYGSTRDWVQAITVVLPTGDVLDLERGESRAHPDGYFDVVLSDRTARVPMPTYRMPSVPKISAGYFAAPEMDLIDLFIGAEGTLGVVTDITLRVVSVRPAVCPAFVPFADPQHALDFVRTVRNMARETWRLKDPRGLDVSAIEHLDARSLELLREDGIDRKLGVTWPAATAIALLVTLELPSKVSPADAYQQIGGARDPDAPDTPLVRFCRLLDAAGVLDHTDIAVPGDRSRAAQLAGVREAVPAAVNDRIGRAKRTVDSRIEKTAADMIVPFERFGDLLALYQAGFRARGLDAAVWGHISDGNVHPNVIPRSFADVESGRAAILDFGRKVIQFGGSPLAEHGVGRNALKQQMLVELYGRSGVDQMRAVKRALDPQWKLAPGVVFSR